MNNNILLIEDDTQMKDFIVDYLKDFNYNCKAFENGKDVLSELENNKNYDIVILDLMLPDIDGFDLFKKIKKVLDIPVIISSARGDIGNKIHGFELGADDYLSKPYEPRELVLRVENIFKKNLSNKIKISNLIIDQSTRSVSIDDFEIDLTKIEFEILIFLVSNLNINTSREQILHATSLDENTKNRTIDTHISNLRYKIGDDSKDPKYIKSVWGHGYKFIG
ncbi:response regulator transcription factor [Poseidonibacter ostreae]|uniref:Response regulator n=1 Tax=Poseidonibacter ostreae TaxID=2654171 RepID=A0ABQ6VQ54_9BACT|nr:response regulator transcription factor [Poseidonibacter ostreae]KAB7884512.1 response regulator [Poseidonibacter ostreae]KAB7892906.1 response regulator [Poseidonibacter ostreae]MAC82758.1 DNA-binding response regulator [Arcobacter sp.]